jgi:hypothetical protein
MEPPIGWVWASVLGPPGDGQTTVTNVVYTSPILDHTVMNVAVERAAAMGGV